MQEQDLIHLKSRVEDLCTSLANVANEKEFQEFLTIIHKPGWTSVAEQAFVSGILNAMQSHAQTLSRLKQTLLEGSRAVKTK
jgi:hypothetical protein